jgi:hypothetical protein
MSNINFLFKKEGIEKMNFNLKLLSQVRQRRRDLGLSIESHTQELEDHEWKNKKVINLNNNKIGIIEKVYKQWYEGWYKVILINFDGSHGIRIFENINCTNQAITMLIRDFNSKIKILED